MDQQSRFNLALWLVLIALAARANAIPVSRIEAYGDSISAGLLSMSPVDGVTSLREVDGIIKDFVRYSCSRDPKYLTAHEARDKAWPRRLAELMGDNLQGTGAAIPVDNLAVSRARSAALLGQVESAPHHDPATAAFFLIGHNDLKDNPRSPDEIASIYSSEYARALVAWDQRHLASTAYLVPIGDLPRVYSTLKGFVWYRSARHDYRCDDSWSVYFPYGRQYYFLFRRHELESDLDPRIHAMNSALERLAVELDRSSRRNHFRFVHGIHDLAYRSEYFAVDCFHLSVTGQQRLAEAIYREIDR
jgi:lysophospholipase L1-like esterase